jgi:hypothetical protein
MPRGRPTNLFREAARQRGEKFYSSFDPCLKCGTDNRYVSNSGCVQCAINRGIARYAAQDETARVAQRDRDHARYVNKKSEDK